MSKVPAVSCNDQQRHVAKYILEKLDSYAHKSHLWQLVHASKIPQSLLRKSRQFSKMHSISEDSVRQCINEFLHSVDQYATQMHRLISSEVSDDLISAFRRPTRINTAWHAMQLERARELLTTSNASGQQNEIDLLESYYRYVENKLTPRDDSCGADRMKKIRDTPFELDHAYAQAESRAKDYLRTIFNKPEASKLPNIGIIDEMVKLGRSFVQIFISW